MAFRRLSENAHLLRYPHPSSLQRTNNKTVHGLRYKVYGLSDNDFRKIHTVTLTVNLKPYTFFLLRLIPRDFVPLQIAGWTFSASLSDFSTLLNGDHKAWLG